MRTAASMRGRAATTAAAALGLAVVGLGAEAGSATGDQPPAGSVTTGEQQLDGTGPRTGHVDAAHATVGAARAAAYAAHHRSARGMGGMGGMGGMAGMAGMGDGMGDMGGSTGSAMAATGSTFPGRTASAAATTTLDPAQYGQWKTLSYKLPLRAIHATLLHTGKFLLIAGSGNVSSDHTIKNFKAYLWDPTTDALTSIPVPYDAFCSGHVVDPNGDVLVFGGTTAYKTSTTPWEGSAEAYKFHVDTSTWERLTPMKQARWYPTSIMDAQGNVYNYTGYDKTGVDPGTPEVYDPTTGTSSFVAPMTFPLYPSLHLLKDGRFAYTGAYYGWTHNKVKPKVFNPRTGASTVVADPNGVINITHRNAAMSALVGSADKQLAWVAGGLSAVRSTYFIDFNAATPTAVAGPDLGAAKGYVSIADLPDLTAFETGGGAGYNSPVYEASMLEPSTRKLTAMAPPSVPRTYHSSALTMPDGRVVTFGGDPSGDANFELRIEVYSPPYLFKGTRPTLGSVPTELHYGDSVSVPATTASGSTPSKVVIMRPGSATHSMDANQRVLQLASTSATGGLKATLPTNPNLAPPGWYLLFVDDSLGRPSVGRWVHLT